MEYTAMRQSIIVIATQQFQQIEKDLDDVYVQAEASQHVIINR